MFTGLVQATGALRQRKQRGPGYRLEIGTDLGPLELGESVSVNGACLTVAQPLAGGFAADISVETNERTTLGLVPIGGRVNLERALRATDRLGGHLVTGHVDAVAEVTAVAPAGNSLRVTLKAPASLMPFVAPKGSVTLDGVSLTVNAVTVGTFEVMLIPHTLDATNLQGIAAGRQLNLEVDLVARYVVRYLETRHACPADPGDGAGLAGALKRAGLL